MPSPFLLFTLAGPMAAWGDVAVGESRPAYPCPSKSAVLGLVGAALGVDRADEQGHQALRAGYGFAVWPTATGHLLLDYHTAQVPTGTKTRGHATRRDELAYGSLNTTLSTRAYYTDARAVVALWARPDARWTLGDLGEALQQPVYPLCLGRRACPPSEPLRPVVADANGLADAFLAYHASAPVPSPPPARTAFSDTDGPGLPAALATATRRDDPVHRGRRAYADRPEAQFTLLDPS